MTNQPFTSAHDKKLIQPLNRDPSFDLYLKSLATCLRNQIDITPLEQWWVANRHLLKSDSFLIDFVGLLERLNVTGKFKGQKGRQSNTACQSKAKRKKFNDSSFFLPWIDSNFKKWMVSHNINRKVFNKLVVNEYLAYLSRYHRRRSRWTYSKPRSPVMIDVTTGTAEHNHLVEISHWVAQKSGIRNCRYVLDTILRSRRERVLYSGHVFEAATKCPCELFDLFMTSDFSGFNLENGKALVFFLSLPVRFDPQPHQGAYLNPDELFFIFQIFKNIPFKANSATMALLKTAWANFYNQWDEVSGGDRLARDTEDFFALTVDSVTGCTDPTASELKNILEEIRPNIWSVQFWLHRVVLGDGSPSVNAARFDKLSCSGINPEFVGYFFVVADYVYKQHRSDLSSCILTCGLFQLCYWADDNEQIFDDFLSTYFPIILNHRRTEMFLCVTVDFMAQFVPLFYAHDMLGFTLLDEIFVVDQSTNAFIDNSHCDMEIDLNAPLVHLYAGADIVDYILLLMTAALNSNGGDIVVVLPHDDDGVLTVTKDSSRLLDTIEQLEKSAKVHGLTCIETTLDDRIPCFVIQLFRGSRPVFINGNGFAGLYAFDHQSSTPIFYSGREASTLLTHRFTLLEQKHAVVLFCET